MAELLESVSDLVSFGGVLAHVKAVVPLQVRVQTRDAIVDRTIYELKMTRPTRLDLYKISFHSVNLDTGVKNTVIDRVRINRAVFLESQLESRLIQALFAGSKDQSGLFEEKAATAIVDAHDLPRSWGPPNTEQWCLIDNSRWEIKNVVNLGNRSFALQVRSTVGQELVRIEDTNNALILTDEVEVE